MTPPPTGTDVRLNLESATEAIARAASTPGFAGYVTVTGVHGVVESQADEALQRIHNRSFLSTPDGMPMVWLGRLAGHRQMDRVYGPDLMERLLARSLAAGAGHYFFGGAAGVVEEMRDSLAARHPGLKIAGAATPPFRPLTDEEWASLQGELVRLRPHYLWVGLSTPKQERLMAEFCERFPGIADGWDHGLILLGVGAAFDFHAGRVRQAPRWLQRAGLEWAFRLLMEPRRLCRRYLRNNPRFLWWVTLQQSGLRKFEMR
jgi:N-acetylglucosaminyldiphosphoundecaprenol N-acetyl-beta-D-mannosaminyltransferase